MIHLDTNYLIGAVVHGSTQDLQIRLWLRSGEELAMSAIAWAEFLCGPVTSEQATLAAAIVGPAIPFVAEDARRAAEFFNITGRRRGTLPDCMIASVCVRSGASLATENAADFRSLQNQGLRLAVDGR